MPRAYDLSACVSTLLMTRRRPLFGRPPVPLPRRPATPRPSPAHGIPRNAQQPCAAARTAAAAVREAGVPTARPRYPAVMDDRRPIPNAAAIDGAVDADAHRDASVDGARSTRAAR